MPKKYQPGCPCCGCPVCVIIRYPGTSVGVVGATVEVVDTTSGVVVSTGTTDGSGSWCSADFPLDHAYSVSVTIDTAYGVEVAFTAEYPAGRDCETTHEYDFCHAKLVIEATDCEGGTPITDLVRIPYLYPDGFTIGVSGGGCTVGPPFQSSVLFYSAQMAAAFAADPLTVPFDPGAGMDGPGTYGDYFFSLRERPYTCDPWTWSWSVQKPPVEHVVDNDGRYKPQCGGGEIECSATHTGEAGMFPLGTEWMPGCLFGCGSGEYGADLNLDCSPSGLLARTLNILITNDDPEDTFGSQVGVEIELTCTHWAEVDIDSTSITAWCAVYESGSLANIHGQFTCCEVGGSPCVTQPFLESAVTLYVFNYDRIGVARLQWDNAGDGCPPGKSVTPASGDTRAHVRAFDGSGGPATQAYNDLSGSCCHPAYFEIEIRDAANLTAVATGIVTE